MVNQIQSWRGSKIVQNAIWLFTGQGLGLFLQAGYFVALARLLGSLEYGIYAGAVALVGTVCQYSTMGSGQLFLRYVCPDHRRFSQYWGSMLLATSVFGSLLVVAINLTARRLISPGSAAIVGIVALSECLCAQLTSCTSQVFQAFEKMRLTASLNLLTSLLRFLLSITMLLVLHHAGARVWALGSLGVSVAASIIAVTTVTMQFGSPSFSLALLKARAIEGITFAVSGSTTSAYNDIDKAMLSHYGMNLANGIYSMAYRVVDIATIPIRSVQSAVVPKLFRIGVDGVIPTFAFAKRILRRTSVIGILGATAMFLLAPIIPHVLGRGFQQSISALRWLCLIPFFRSFHLSAGDAVTAAGHQRWRLLTQFSAALINVLANIVLIPRYGWLGAAWSSLMTDGLLGIANWLLLYVLVQREGNSYVVSQLEQAN